MFAIKGQDPELVRRRMAAVLEGNPVATLVLDTSHRIILWNRACEVLTGIPAAQVLGTSEQWRPFYPNVRPIMADLILFGEKTQQMEHLYAGKFRPSAVIPGAYEAEDFFPALGDGGRWLFFTAAPVYDEHGELIAAIETLQDVTARKIAEEKLRQSEERFREMSVTDALTGLFNSRCFHERLAHELERAKRYQQIFSLIVMDIDHFKRVNDEFGHQGGDNALRQLAQVILRSIRASDAAFRYGGEEFAVFLPGTDLSGASVIAERIRVAFASTPVEPLEGIQHPCTVSLGVAQYQDGDSVHTLFRRADEAAYQAKHLGRNCVVLSPALAGE